MVDMASSDPSPAALAKSSGGGSASTGMAERVARAMAVADGCDPDDPAFVRYPGGVAFGLCWHDKYAAKARAAIEAMREPTEAMLHAYTEAADDTDGPAAMYLQTAAYSAMIDAALKD